MQVYLDKHQNIFTDLDYCEDPLAVKSISLVHSKENFHVDHEDFVASVPGSMTLGELDHNLLEFGMFSNIKAPLDYPLSKVIAENHDTSLFKKVLGLNLIHPNEYETQAGAKVIKNVSGYDMKKLYIGSFNSLALIANAFISLEKRFEQELVIKFKPANNLQYLIELRDFIQSFLDKRISLKVQFNKKSNDFSVEIKTSESSKILEYRKKVFTDFLTNKISIASALDISLVDFSPTYKEKNRIELEFNFSDMHNILEKLKQNILIEPLLGMITLNDFDDLNMLLEYGFHVRVFPVNPLSRKLVKGLSFSNKESILVEKIKLVYDEQNKLNPGLL